MMRRPRCRRFKRSRRAHSKDTYRRSALTIQRCFRRYLKSRYEKLCANSMDDECIMLQPVSNIPRAVFVVVDGMAFDSRHLLSWMTKSNSHPLTRKAVSDELKKKCVDKAVMFLRDEQKRISNRKGYYSRKRMLKRTLDRISKGEVEKCGLRRRTRFSSLM